MPGEPSYLVDTNVLLRLSKADDPQHGLVRAAIDKLFSIGAVLCYTSQNLAEFWNVCTRPVDRNGLGLSIPETDRRTRAIENVMALLPDGEPVHRELRLLVTYEVRGVQVHDARLAAVMLVHGVRRVLTLNQSDFTRFVGVTAVHPRTLT